jgi:PTH2 family peptidyl-tRNA hydrolase
MLGEGDLIKANYTKFEENPFRFKMVFVVNGDLKMGKGKICAQVAHACLSAYLQMEDVARFDQEAKLILESWDTMGCAKIVVRCES